MSLQPRAETEVVTSRTTSEASSFPMAGHTSCVGPWELRPGGGVGVGVSTPEGGASAPRRLPGRQQRAPAGSPQLCCPEVAPGFWAGTEVPGLAPTRLTNCSVRVTAASLSPSTSHQQVNVLFRTTIKTNQYDVPQMVFYSQ